MELIKDLPSVFDGFAEQRKNSFLTVREYKEKGIPIVGSYCTYFPKEIAMAAGPLRSAFARPRMRRSRMRRRIFRRISALS